MYLFNGILFNNINIDGRPANSFDNSISSVGGLSSCMGESNCRSVHYNSMTDTYNFNRNDNSLSSNSMGSLNSLSSPSSPSSLNSLGSYEPFSTNSPPSSNTLFSSSIGSTVDTSRSLWDNNIGSPGKSLNPNYNHPNLAGSALLDYFESDIKNYWDDNKDMYKEMGKGAVSGGVTGAMSGALGGARVGGGPGAITGSAIGGITGSLIGATGAYINHAMDDEE